MVVAFIFLRVKAPRYTFKEQMQRMDWIGNFMIILFTTLTIVALSFGGVRYSWSSATTLVMLILGLLGLVLSVWYEKTFPKEPVIPWDLFANRTAITGYVNSMALFQETVH